MLPEHHCDPTVGCAYPPLLHELQACCFSKLPQLRCIWHAPPQGRTSRPPHAALSCEAFQRLVVQQAAVGRRANAIEAGSTDDQQTTNTEHSAATSDEIIQRIFAKILNDVHSQDCSHVSAEFKSPPLTTGRFQHLRREHLLCPVPDMLLIVVGNVLLQQQVQRRRSLAEALDWLDPEIRKTTSKINRKVAATTSDLHNDRAARQFGEVCGEHRDGSIKFALAVFLQVRQATLPRILLFHIRGSAPKKPSIVFNLDEFARVSDAQECEILTALDLAHNVAGALRYRGKR
mmetsp:Transcript_91101/g.260659  ORF Transcript_91101/g.260659 Transcript_91101/m.260659 type:complete len:289 (-) Transcript_91101:432-1298(-)